MNLKMKEIRKLRGLTQQELADEVGATKRQVGAWERGENDIPMDYAVAIAERLKCTVDDIAGRDVQYFFISDAKSEKFDRLMDTFKSRDELRELTAIYRDLPDEGREQLIIFARGLAQTYQRA